MCMQQGRTYIGPTVKKGVPPILSRGRYDFHGGPNVATPVLPARTPFCYSSLPTLSAKYTMRRYKTCRPGIIIVVIVGWNPLRSGNTASAEKARSAADCRGVAAEDIDSTAPPVGGTECTQ